ncbi:MAG: D-alanyl-D-alanine carboxypeptidase/D-alanyl-D-alanine-endopeptidase [Chitinophagaceae bacterium]|nr:D-alanyl-D-alanine carboxypeptidase/D-alanyl-D-alanine-endopeptidase [Chitinophagaceae bacterium]
MMLKNLFSCIALLLLQFSLLAQDVSLRLQKTFQQFENDSQLLHAISSLYVLDAATGKPVFDKQAQTGLAPASTQKIITAATAFEMLGQNFRYQTYLAYNGEIVNGELKGDLIFKASGDPTLGSTRWNNTSDSSVLKKIKSILDKAGIKKISGDILVDENEWGVNPLPDGWIWQDIGNYYGAGARGFNWKENQYDLILKPGAKPGDTTSIIKTKPMLQGFHLENYIKTGAAGSGDNGYIYVAPNSQSGFATGTIPAGVGSFTISGSMPQPSKQFVYEVSQYLMANGINVNFDNKLNDEIARQQSSAVFKNKILDSIASPSLDSIVYWFLRKSVNLYGEALIKTLALNDNKEGNTENGVATIKRFWVKAGIDNDALNIYDGSGLSPLNRVTTHAQVAILQYAKTRKWFPAFYDALPIYNGMKMKSGTISDVKGFCGYHKSKNGGEYIFSFLINNYSGKTAPVVNKMYQVLDALK